MAYDMYQQWIRIVNRKRTMSLKIKRTERRVSLNLVIHMNTSTFSRTFCHLTRSACVVCSTVVLREATTSTSSKAQQSDALSQFLVIIYLTDRYIDTIAFFFVFAYC